MKIENDQDRKIDTGQYFQIAYLIGFRFFFNFYLYIGFRTGLFIALNLRVCICVWVSLFAQLPYVFFLLSFRLHTSYYMAVFIGT